MIHFRYHLISLVAVFLALGIGIVMGSTVVDKAIVDSLKNRIDRAEENSIARKIENNSLRSELKGQNQQNTVLAGHSVRGYLTSLTVVVVAVGDVPEDVVVETRELLAVSGARLGAEIIINDDFANSDKATLANELKAVPGVSQIVGEETNKNKVVANVLFSMLNQRALGQTDPQLPTDQLQAIFDQNNAFQQRETSQANDPVQPVSFIVLVNRANLKNENFSSFVGGFVTPFNTTIGFNGSETQTPSRAASISKFNNQLPNWMVVDNVESPSGRATLLIAHSRKIFGVNGIYGVSSKAKNPAPELAIP